MATSLAVLRFLLDEHVRPDVADFLRERGHEVYFVRQRLPAGVPDPLIVAEADKLGAIIMTWNRKHFRPLVTRDPSRRSAQFPNAGLITFQCRLESAVPLLRRFMPNIEFESVQRQHDPDTRVIVEINENGMLTR